MTSWPSTTSAAVRGRPEGRVEDGAILGRVDPDAVEHVRPALLDPGSPGDRRSSGHRLVGDPVLAVVEEQAGTLGGQALGALRVLREQLPQVAVPDGGVVVQDRLPLGHPVQGGGNRRLVRAHVLPA